jgi:ubiquinone/menaquinone biosynthesis C-methylase UbiE
MVHHSKEDIQIALSEMYRVLKPNGICFVSFMSEECWPMDGIEVKPSEFLCREHGQQVIHSIFSDSEALQFCANWHIADMVKQSIYSPEDVSLTTLAEWEEYYTENEPAVERQEWTRLYPQRMELWKRVHLFFILRK